MEITFNVDDDIAESFIKSHLKTGKPVRAMIEGCIEQGFKIKNLIDANNVILVVSSGINANQYIRCNYEIVAGKFDGGK